MGENDPEIRAAVAAWNAVRGVATHWSCQGVSGLVTYDGHEVVAVSPHDAQASIEFTAVSAPAADAVYTLALGYPTIHVVGASYCIGTGDDRHVERSVHRIESMGGNANLAFRRDTVRLAERVRLCL